MPDERGPNDRRIADLLDRHLNYITRVQNDAEAATLVDGRGYGKDAIGAGLALHARALKAYTARDRASGTRSTSSGALAAADKTARRLLGEVRGTLYGLYDGQPAHLETLGVDTERLAADRNRFLTESRSTLAAVRDEPYASAAAGAGLKADKLDAADAAIAALATAAGDLGTSTGARKVSTGTRNVAFDDFQAWMTRFRRFVNLAVRDHPDVAARLKG